MRDGFFKAAAVVPAMTIADPESNAKEMIRCLREAAGNGAKLIAFPELAVTGYTGNDLFLQDMLLRGAEDALRVIRDATTGLDALVFAGFPLEWKGKLYNTAAVLQNGRILAFIPKRCLPDYAEFYEPGSSHRGLFLHRRSFLTEQRFRLAVISFWRWMRFVTFALRARSARMPGRSMHRTLSTRSPARI